jgi:hypothetical protein
MKKGLIFIFLLLVASVFLMAQQCTLQIPDQIGVTLETGQVTAAETTAAQATEQAETPKTRSNISTNVEMVFLIITIASFVIAVVSAIFGFRKDNENTGGKILFAVFIVLFLVFLILYILSLVNII